MLRTKEFGSGALWNKGRRGMKGFEVATFPSKHAFVAKISICLSSKINIKLAFHENTCDTIFYLVL